MRGLSRLRQSGDTIVEVMAAITIAGLAIGAAYALSNRSYLTGVHTRDRTEALSLAQAQVEILRDRGLTGNINSLKTPTPFCFDDETNQTLALPDCGTYKDSIYDISVTYCDGSAADCEVGVFSVKTSWIAGGTGNQNQLELHYRPQALTVTAVMPDEIVAPLAALGGTPGGGGNPNQITNTSANLHGIITLLGDPPSEANFYFQLVRCTARNSYPPAVLISTDGCDVPSGSSWTPTSVEPVENGSSCTADAVDPAKFYCSQLITGFIPGNAYLFRVIAFNSAGTATDTGTLTSAQLSSIPPNRGCGDRYVCGTQSFWTCRNANPPGPCPPQQ